MTDPDLAAGLVAELAALDIEIINDGGELYYWPPPAASLQQRLHHARDALRDYLEDTP